MHEVPNSSFSPRVGELCPQDCYAPYGLSGIYAGTLTANPATPYPELFAKKVASYKARWNWLQVEPTDGA